MHSRSFIKMQHLSLSLRTSLSVRGFILALILLCSISLSLISSEYLPENLAFAGALVLLTVGMLATGLVSEQLAILIFFFLAVVLSISPPEVVFSGFNSSAFWLVFGGLIIGVAVEKTGLGGRVAKSIIHRIKGNYSSVIAVVIVLNILLIFLMPSTLSRVVLLIPITLALGDSLGYSVGSSPRNGIVMATVLTAYLGSTSVLPANVPNNVLMGAAEAFQGIQFHYFSYLVLHFPVLGFLKSFVIWLCVVWLFGPKGKNFEMNIKLEPRSSPTITAFTTDERRLSFFLILALFLWSTDKVHGVAPAWISLGVGILCLLPLLGVVSPGTFKEKVPINPLLYVAGIIGVGAVVADTGLGAFISDYVIHASDLSPDDPVRGFFVLSGIAMLLGFFATMPGVPAILVPIAADLSSASGLELRTVLMTQVVGFSTVWLPYQVPPIIVGMQLAGVPMSAGIKITALIGLISFVILNPLVMLWWQILGYLPNGVLW
ncbi:MAG: sodium:sulfate symporter [Rhodospirillaceae bacterium]|nr:sodium:sulfate symporter [Rhodospirillaceae bacterium]